MQTETKHTPGSWRTQTAEELLSDGYVAEIDPRDVYVVAGEGDALSIVATVAGAHSALGGDPEARANGRLLAAAPDLLDALDEVKTWIRNWDPAFVSDEEWPATRERIDAAIAKAKGGAR